MANTRFSGPVTSDNGFIGAITGNVTATTITATGAIAGLTLAATGTGGAKLAVRTLASLPAAAAGNAGTIYFVSGTSSGSTLVFSSGSDNIDLVTGVAVIA